MKKKRRTMKSVAILIMVTVLILDSKAAIAGAREGVTLCMQTLLPSLFPLLFTTSLLVPCMTFSHNGFSRLLCWLFRIPAGSQGVLLTGLLGGYPVGARSVGQAFQDGQLTQQTASRMLIFCNASGPAFIFGIGCNLFQSPRIPWLLWGIHILSCLITARLLGPKNNELGSSRPPTAVSLPEALRCSLRGMAEICGWVILMRVLISIMSRWCLWYLPPVLRLIFTGLLELTNGCLCLSELSSQGLSFVLNAAFLGFGGLCVALQTFSAAATVSTRLYLPGKLLQCCISILIAGLLHPLIFEADLRIAGLMAAAAFMISICLFWLKKAENRSRNLDAVGV